MERPSGAELISIYKARCILHLAFVMYKVNAVQPLYAIAEILLKKEWTNDLKYVII